MLQKYFITYTSQNGEVMEAFLTAALPCTEAEERPHQGFPVLAAQWNHPGSFKKHYCPDCTPQKCQFNCSKEQPKHPAVSLTDEKKDHLENLIKYKLPDLFFASLIQ